MKDNQNFKNILILGSFGYENNQLDGQTIKTRQILQLLKENYQGKVDYFSTETLREKTIQILYFIYKLLIADIIITIYATSGGFQTMLPAIYRLTKVFFLKKIIYIAIGSTQVDCIEGKGIYNKKRKDLLQISRNIHAFLAETHKVKNTLMTKYHFNNVGLFPNFRYFNQNIPFSPASRGTLRLVFFARITPQKGYDVVFEFVNSIKDKPYDITVDFYGQMDGKCNEEFLALIDKFSIYGVKYKGVLQQQDIYSTLRHYDVLVFPTKIDGIPGSIIDGYISSLTVVATNWEYANEIINDKENGFIVPAENPIKQDKFNKCILKLYNDRDLLEKMKRNAYESRMKYSAGTAWKILEKYLN